MRDRWSILRRLVVLLSCSATFLPPLALGQPAAPPSDLPPFAQTGRGLPAAPRDLEVNVRGAVAPLPAPPAPPPGVARGGTYYVAPHGSDANPGTQEAPVQTIATGLSRLRSGETLYLRGGTYHEAIAPGVGGIPNGTSWATATIIAGYPGETVTLAPLSGTAGIALGDSGQFGYLIFDNLIVDAGALASAGTLGYNGVYLGSDTHHIRLSNCEIRNSPRTSVFGAGTANEVLNCRIHGAAGYGFYYAGRDSLIENNEIYNHGGYAFHLYATSATDVDRNILRNNRIYGNGLTSNGPGSGGVILSHGSQNQAVGNLIYGNFAGVQVDYGCLNCQVCGNTITDNLTYSISVGPGAVGTLVANNTVAGNGSDLTTTSDPSAVRTAGACGSAR